MRIAFKCNTMINIFPFIIQISYKHDSFVTRRSTSRTRSFVLKRYSYLDSPREYFPNVGRDVRRMIPIMQRTSDSPDKKSYRRPNYDPKALPSSISFCIKKKKKKKRKRHRRKMEKEPERKQTDITEIE